MLRSPGFEELFARLVGFDTTSHRSNLEAVDWLADVLEHGGMRVVRQLSSDGDKANLLAWAGPDAEPGRDAGLALSGHLDVVPAGEPDWESDPFTLTDGGDRWTGRGTADMKGFLALACELALELRTQRLTAPLALLFTYDEEVGSLGAARLAGGLGELPPLPRAVLVGEPTRLQAVRLHKGHLRLAIELRGKPAHSGHPQRGVSAVEAAGRAIVALSELRRTLEGERPEHSEHFPEVPFVALNVARVEGGGAVNVIAERCRLDIGIRPLPEMTAEALVKRVRETVAAAVGDESEVTWELAMRHESPPLLAPDDAPLHRALCEAIGQRRTVSAAFASDAGFLSRAGFDCVLWGPGDIAAAHRANEFLPKADVARARGTLTALIRRFCTNG
ncbi:MAG: acetylornithine deacetylase [Thermoanaerobaculia bacterium]